MEDLRNVENSLRGELLRLHNELKGFHLRVIKLESENRSNQSEIRSLKTELNERKENEQKLTNTVEKLMIESGEFKNKLVKLEEQVNNKNNRDDTSPPHHPTASQPIPVDGSIPMPLSQPTGNDVQEILNSLSTEIHTKFGSWDGKQGNLQKEVENLKQVISHFDSPTNLNQVRSSPETPSIPLSTNIHVAHNNYEEDDDIQILSPPTLLMSTPTSHPPPPPPYVDAYAIVHGKEDQAYPGNSLNGGWITSPVPGHSFPMDNIQSSPSGNTSGRGTSKSRPRTGKWNLPHGYDNTDPSGLSCLCGTHFNSIRCLRWHIHYFTEEWQFSCEVCHRRFAKNHTLTEHKKRIHRIFPVGGSYGCRYCGLIFPSSNEHRGHIGRCEKRISAQISARINAVIQQGNMGHDQVPGSTPPQTTQDARTVTPFKSRPRNANAAVRNLNFDQIKKEVMDPTDNELGSSHGKDPARKLTCVCSLTFQNNRSLTRHVRYHTVKRYRCRPCGKWFAYACYRNAHVLRAHKHQASAGAGGGSQLSQL